MTAHTLRGPGEIIATIPTLLGFVPQESVVVVIVTASGEIALTVRVDRADLLVPEVARDVAESVIAQLRRVRARSAVVVSFTRSDVTLGCDGADALVGEIGASLEHVSVWATDGFSYRAPGCADAECCPPGGRVVPWPREQSWLGWSGVRVEVQAPPPQRIVAPERDRRRAARAGDRSWSRREPETAAWRQEAFAGVVDSLAPAADVLTLGRAAVALRDVRVRDALIVTWLRGSSGAVTDVIEGRTTQDVAAALDGALTGGECLAPTAGEIRFALHWCERMLALARRRDQAAIHALSATVLWYSGDGDAARLAARDALACDDGYSLAHLVHDVCVAGLAPAWLR